MALPPEFLEELRARTPLPAVVGRRVKLSRSGRQWKGCCPFHGEKTPSFYVYDDHFHCFGCGAHGDAISFAMQSQGASFMEAVEQLAAEAGMEVPKPTPARAAAERLRADIHTVLAEAAAAFQRRLSAPEGARAREYLERRGLTQATIERFGIGWSGDGRGALLAELAEQGIAAEQVVEAGLTQASDGARAPRELFFNRVMFPIRDRRGRVISFGGRVLGDGQPKYLNGPETTVFSKRRTLFGLDQAKSAVAKGAPVVVVEGYMDVIALHQSGFGGAVAPLGTALTEEQLAELWRLSPSPVLCFDGDAAGGRAAARAAEAALPLLAPDRTLKVAALPSGEDPDTLIAKQGAAAFRALLDRARPLSEALFDLLGESGMPATPEARAAFRQRLEAAAGRIPDRALAAEYRRALLDRYFAGARSRPGTGAPRRIALPARMPPVPGQAQAERCRNLLAILLRHPKLLHDVEEALDRIEMPAPWVALRESLVHWWRDAEQLDSSDLLTHLRGAGLAELAAQALSAAPYPLPACARPDAQAAEAEEGWWHIFGLMDRERLRAEVDAARRGFEAAPGDLTQRRLIALCAAQERLARGEQDGEPL